MTSRSTTGTDKEITAMATTLKAKSRPAEILREYGPYPGIDPVHGVTFDGAHVWFARGESIVAFDPTNGTLVRELADRGHQVAIANSRGPDSLTEFTTETGGRPSPLSTPLKPEKSSSWRSRRRPSPSFRGVCLRTYGAASS
jgi:hypothetical protein